MVFDKLIITARGSGLYLRVDYTLKRKRMSPSRVASQLGITYSLPSKGTRSFSERKRLYVETEENNVSILHHVFFTFGTNQTFFFCSSNRAVGDQILEGDNFSTDKPRSKSLWILPAA